MSQRPQQLDIPRRTDRNNFTQSFQDYYENFRGERNPEQSGFVSSTNWTPGDAKWYKAQTIFERSEYLNPPPNQDGKVSSSSNQN